MALLQTCAQVRGVAPLVGRCFAAAGVIGQIAAYAAMAVAAFVLVLVKLLKCSCSSCCLLAVYVSYHVFLHLG